VATVVICLIYAQWIIGIDLVLKNKFGESSVLALPRPKTLLSRYLHQNHIFVRKAMFWS
jgi:hypothetical protein